MKRARNGESGQALIMTTMGIMVIFGLLGLVVDVGWMNYRQEAAQMAADAAAMAASQAAVFYMGHNLTCDVNNVTCQSTMYCPETEVTPPITSSDVACSYAAANGFRNAGRQTVSVAAGTGTNAPTAPGVTVDYWITVRVTERLPQLFSAIYGHMNGLVAARATAAVTGSGSSSCVYALSPTGSNALTASGTGTTVTATCGVFVDSTSSTAVVLNGGAKVTSWAVRIVGGYVLKGGSTISPTPTTGGTPAPDPFAKIPVPTFSGCDHTAFSIGSGAIVTMHPGVYCNGITINGGGVGHMEPGMYVINGGGLSINGGGTLNGSGVTVFDTATAGHTYGAINIAGSATMNMSAPLEGTYRGILFFGDPVAAAGSNNTFGGGASMNLTGSLYFPTATVSFNGGSITTITAILASKVSFTGGSSLAYDPTGAKTGLGTVNANLIE